MNNATTSKPTQEDLKNDFYLAQKAQDAVIDVMQDCKTIKFGSCRSALYEIQDLMSNLRMQMDEETDNNL